MKQLNYLETLKLVKRSLEEYKNWGQDEVYKAPRTSAVPVKTEINQMKKITTSKAGTALTLKELETKLKKCKECPLGKSRLNCVFGQGSETADLMFVGEGPGFEEDHKGLPFIGRSGQLLTKIIEAMGYSRESVYIANIVKCHPMKDPTNPELHQNDRPPTPQEMDTCRKFLDMQIEIIKPKIIVTLGASSTNGLLQIDEPIGQLRGKMKEYKGIKLMPTYHPALLVRNSNFKKDVWEDMKKVMKFLK